MPLIGNVYKHQSRGGRTPFKKKNDNLEVYVRMKQAKSVKAEKKDEKEVKAEVKKAERMHWIKSGAWLIRYRFIHPKTNKQRLYYAKDEQNLVDRIDRLNIKYLLGNIEKFNTETKEWEVIEKYN